MEIRNNVSTNFKSIQVGLSKMTSNQRRISDRLFRTIKYSEKYSKMTGMEANNDLDIYMLGKPGKGVEVRFMDPYSGNFVRGEDGKIIRTHLGSLVNEKVEAVADAVIDTYKKIIDGVIKRPKEDVSKMINGKTEMARINPAKQEDFYSKAKQYKDLCCTQQEAEEQAFEEYKSLYHVDNKDADF